MGILVTSNRYFYKYNVTTIDAQGDALVQIFVQDEAGNNSTYQNGSLLSIDTFSPSITNVNIDVEENRRGVDAVAYAKLGSKVLIDFSVSEQLLNDPIVLVDNNLAIKDTKTSYSDSRIDYSYYYVVSGSDSDGVKVVSINTTDLTGNITLQTFNNSLVIDKTTPLISNLSYSQNPIKAGVLAINFNVSEGLKSAPTLEVTQYNAAKQTVISTGQWSIVGGKCSATYSVFSSANGANDGTCEVKIYTKDKALNATVEAFNNLIVDTIKPVFLNISSTVNNPDFSKYGKEGSKVEMTFQGSERLKYDPEVKINGKAANSVQCTVYSVPYEYKSEYIVTGIDSDGNAAISISGYDDADNLGEIETNSSAESFVIDLTSPTVIIADPEAGTDLIASPSPFSTNANPEDGKNSTTLRYETTEYGYVTVKVYKVDDEQKSYIKNDFVESKRVATLISGTWMESGAHNNIWDGRTSVAVYDANSDGFADSGKYAFIVEVKDKAGNVTEYKYGGTVWIQNNVLYVMEPESVGINPDPYYFGPNGNGVNKTTRFWFRVRIGLTPGQSDPPERITAMSLPDDMLWLDGVVKKIGTYTVRVYDSSNNLIRTIIKDQPVESSVDTYVIWDGMRDGREDEGGGMKIAENGIYRIEVDVKDFAANNAYNNLFSKTVMVDNTLPSVSENILSEYYFSPDGSGVKDSTLLSYSVNDNLNTVEVDIDISNDGVATGSLQSTATLPSNASYSNVWSNQGIDKDGKYTYKIYVKDVAENYVEVAGEAIVDRTEPSGEVTFSSANYNSGKYYINSSSVTLALTYSDMLSGIEDTMRFSNDGTNWNNWESLASTKSWNLTAGDGEKRVYVQFVDNAGNYGEYSSFVILDTDNVDVLWSGQAANTWYTGNNAININLSDINLKGFKWNWDTPPSDDTSECILSTTGTNNHPGEGERTLYLKAWDWAGNKYEESRVYKRDVTAPTISFGGQAPDVWYSGNNAITVSLADNLSYKGFKWSWDSMPTDDSTGCNTSATGTTSHPGEGMRTLYVKGWDEAGNIQSTQKDYWRDITAPRITPPEDKTFNPYLNSLSLSFSVNNSGGSGIGAVTARIEKTTDGTLIKDLPVSGSYPSYSINWTGMNNAGDYVNEGNYRLKITASDSVGNFSSNTTCDTSLQDDQYIEVGESPSLTISGNNLILSWINGNDIQSKTESFSNLSFSEFFIDKSLTVYIDSDQQIKLNMSGYLEVGMVPPQCGEVWYIIKNSAGINVYEKNLYAAFSYAFVQGNNSLVNGVFYSYNQYNNIWETGDMTTSSYNLNETVSLSKGEYTFYISIKDAYSSSAATSYASLGIEYSDFKLFEYQKTCPPEYEDNIEEAATSSPLTVDSYTTGPTSSGQHSVWASDGNIYYKRNNSPSILIGQSGYNPAICVDQYNNAYISWQDTRSGANQIYFQKIPSNFASVNGTVTASSLNNVKLISSIEALAQNTKPILLAPDDGAIVTTLRPTFKWQGIKGRKNYKLILSQMPNLLEISSRSFDKIITQTEATPINASDPIIAYSIHEFDEGLSRGIWYWKVVSDSNTTTEASSDIRSFEVDPPLTLAGITNYPNPFNPNKESTKIRYKLGKDVDDVCIRIYDITGRLVVELDGLPYGEASNIWQKYNDVPWDGRNARGDMVINGIYPFEVLATLNGQSVSGRGKIALLK